MNRKIPRSVTGYMRIMRTSLSCCCFGLWKEEGPFGEVIPGEGEELLCPAVSDVAAVVGVIPTCCCGCWWGGGG